MSTFPRRVKLPPPVSVKSAKPLLTRTTSDFDAGINSSNAWTEHLERELDSLSNSLSDDDKGERPSDAGRNESGALEELEHGELAMGRPARVLYDFEGQQEYQELCLKAGDELEILTEDLELADGWSFARIPLGLEDEGAVERGREVGLVPRSYYAFTTDFVYSPNAHDEDGDSHFIRVRDASSSTLTPRASVVPTTPPAAPPAESELSPRPPLIPQNTGEWFRQQLQLSAVRRSLLGGKSLNRFSAFVTSGAEAFVLQGAPPSAAAAPKAKKPTMGANGEVDAGLPPALDWRLSAYVGHGKETSGASAGSAGSDPDADPDTHAVDFGPVWRSKVPPFNVRVHSPEKRQPQGGAGAVGAFTMYSVTSSFSAPEAASSDLEDSEDEDEAETGTKAEAEIKAEIAPQMITVQRRFSHFVFLHTALAARLPGIALPALPEKQYAGRFSSEFIEARRGELERYLRKVVRHPVARYTDVLTFFLSCESEVEWRRQLPYHLRRPPAGPAFYAHVYHPAFHFDAEDAEDTVERFENHTRAIDCGVQQLRGSFGKIRSARVEMSNAERLLSYSILSLITSTPLASASGLDEDDDSDDDDADNYPASPNSRFRRGCRRKKGLLDSDGAWCWREDCVDCLRLTKCMQKTAETFQGVADLYDNHALRTMLATEDSFKDVAHPNTVYSPVVDIHKAALTRYKEASSAATTSGSGIGSNDKDNLNDPGEVAARCETVLNTTMAEFDVYHTQKREDFARITTGHLDDEIAFYEKVLSRLRTTRALFDAPPAELDLIMPGPRTPSMYERDLADPPRKRAPDSLSQPCPHPLDASAMRPVSAAIQGGVGMLFGASTNGKGGGARRAQEAEGEVSGRGSVFSRFW